MNESIRAAFRLSLGLAGISVILVMMAATCGLIPRSIDQQRLKRDSFCESLAIHAAIAANRNDVQGLNEIMRVLVDRNADVETVVLTTAAGSVKSQFGESMNDRSTSTAVAEIPILIGGNPWGRLQITFAQSQPGLIGSIFADPALSTMTFMATVGLTVFFVYCYWLTLRMRKKGSRGMPRRVRDTLNSFSEGVLVLDPQQRIAFANDSFCETAGAKQDEIEGNQASALRWIASDVEQVPWYDRNQHEVKHAAIQLHHTDDSVRSLSATAVPIADDKGNVFGSLATFDDLTTVQQMNQRLKHLLQLLRQSRHEVRNQNKVLKRLATMDPLTDCLNRRAFFQQFEAVFALAKRHQHPLSCIMMDIDYFKSINDNHGHAVGDDVLRAVAEVLKSACRDGDLLCRFGGEEFCFVLPHTDLDGAKQAAERIRKMVEELDVEGLRLTISLGVSDLSYGAANGQAILEQADQSLYHAKHTGRNRVSTIEDLLMPIDTTDLQNA